MEQTSHHHPAAAHTGHHDTHGTSHGEHGGSHGGHHVHTGHHDHADHAGHGPHAGHGQHHHGRHGHHSAGHHGHTGHGGSSWRTAAQATLHCLTGCAIGEILGMIIGTGLGLAAGATVTLSVALAFFFGYALTMRGVLKAGLPARQALKVALAADTISILVMEIIDNTAMVTIPGAMDAGLADILFWGALAASLVLAFLVTVPVNRWLIARGKGHAVVHAYH